MKSDWSLYSDDFRYLIGGRSVGEPGSEKMASRRGRFAMSLIDQESGSWLFAFCGVLTGNPAKYHQICNCVPA